MPLNVGSATVTLSLFSICRLLNLELAQKYGPKAWQAHIESLTAAQTRCAFTSAGNAGRHTDLALQPPSNVQSARLAAPSTRSTPQAPWAVVLEGARHLLWGKPNVGALGRCSSVN